MKLRAIAIILLLLAVIGTVQASIIVPPVIDKNHLVLWYRFDEANNTVAIDYSGNGYNGTIYGSPYVTTGRYGYGLSFDGVNDYINTSIPISDGITISFWAKIDRYVCIEIPNWYGISVECWRTLYKIRLATTNSTIHDVVGSWSLSGWHMITVTYDGINTLRVYLDGKLVCEDHSYLGNLSYSGLVVPVRINYNPTWGIFGNGTIDEVRIYNVSLNATEIRDMYEALRVRFYDELNGTKIKANATIFNSNYSITLPVDDVTKEAVLFYADLPQSGEYRLVVSKSGYEPRIYIVNLGNGLLDMDTAIPPISESVLNIFVLKDYAGIFNPTKTILKLRKYVNGKLITVFSNYFDTYYQTQTYLIPNTYYQLDILYNNTEYNLGWIQPNLRDGIINVIPIKFTVLNLTSSWFKYDILYDNGNITVNYVSSNPIDIVEVYINATNGSNLYYSYLTTQNGSFNYVGNSNQTYLVHIYARDLKGNVFTVTRLVGRAGIQPVRFPLFPQGWPKWLYNLISVGIIVVTVLLFGQVRSDVACVLGAIFAALFWYWGWLRVEGIVVALAMVIAGAAVIYRSRRLGV